VHGQQNIKILHKCCWYSSAHNFLHKILETRSLNPLQDFRTYKDFVLHWKNRISFLARNSVEQIFYCTIKVRAGCCWQRTDSMWHNINSLQMTVQNDTIVCICSKYYGLLKASTNSINTETQFGGGSSKPILKGGLLP